MGSVDLHERVVQPPRLRIVFINHENWESKLTMREIKTGIAHKRWGRGRISRRINSLRCYMCMASHLVACHLTCPTGSFWRHCSLMRHFGICASTLQYIQNSTVYTEHWAMLFPLVHEPLVVVKPRAPCEALLVRSSTDLLVQKWQ